MSFVSMIAYHSSVSRRRILIVVFAVGVAGLLAPPVVYARASFHLDNGPAVFDAEALVSRLEFVRQILPSMKASFTVRQQANRERAESMRIKRVTNRLLGEMEAYDPEFTMGHLDRCYKQVSRFVPFLRTQGVSISAQEEETIRRAVLFHDVGKLEIPASLLHKRGPLSVSEFEVMKQHAALGAKRLVADGLPDEASLVLSHQEFYNGAGYPNGIAGDQIPLGSRIISIIDAYDAMTNDRPYQQARPIDVALRELASKAGTQFDPQITAAWIDFIRSETLTANAPAVAKPKVSYVRLRDYVSLISATMPRVFLQEFVRQESRFPVVCHFASAAAAELLRDYFGDALNVRYVPGQRFNATHYWLELNWDEGLYFLSFSEGQFVYTRDPLLQRLRDTSEKDFLARYTALGYARASLLKIENLAFYWEHALEKDPDLFSMSNDWQGIIKEIVRRTKGLMADMPPGWSAPPEQATLENRMLGPENREEKIYYWLSAQFFSEIHSLGIDALSTLQKVITSEEWSQTTRTYAQQLFTLLEKAA